MNGEVNEFSIGNMAPVVQPDQILSKSGDYNYVDDAFDAVDLKIFNDEDTTNGSPETFTEAKKIDDDMIPIIKSLEGKGYDVKYSCSGHPSARVKNDGKRDGVRYGNLYTTARIVFGKIYDIGAAPDGWVKRTLNSKDSKDGNEYTALYVDDKLFKISDGTPKNAFYKWKSSYMDSLKKWVDELPSNNRSEGTDSSIEESVDINVSVDSLLDNLFVDML